MIIVKGYGQMCNNWLQYAHAYAWGRENGVRVVSMRFSYKYRYFRISELPVSNPLTYLAAKLLIKARAVKCLWLQEPYMVTADVLRQLRTSPLIAIDGWNFRHPELLLKYRGELLSLFAFRPGAVASKARWLGSLPRADIRLGLHIRRGDYARWNGGAYFFTDGEYARAVSEFCRLHPGKTVQVLVATNDPKTDFGLLRREGGAAGVFPIGGNPGEDLYALSECDCIIGPKSTFSLVAAFYRDVPLCWMHKGMGQVSEASFGRFADLFMSV